MYAALDESMVFYHPTDLPQGFVVTYENSGDKKLAQVQSGPERSTHDPRKLFERVFEPIIHASTTVRAGYVYGEIVDDVRTLLRRYYKFNEGGNLDLNKDCREATTYNNTFSNLIRMYCFARGGIRWMIVPSRTTTAFPSGFMFCTLRQIVPPMNDATTPVERTSPRSGAPGFPWVHSSQGKALQIEVPYTNNVNFFPLSLSQHPDEYYNMLVPLFSFRTDKSTDANPLSYDYWIAIADDFTMGWLHTTPHVKYTIVPAIKKRSAK
jgi:hypothetical protein